MKHRRLKTNDRILKRIPKNELSIQQKTILINKKDFSIYRFVREPSSLEDIVWKNYPFCDIWRENETLITVCHSPFEKDPRKCIAFTLYNFGKLNLSCAIYGETDAAIAETAAFFWSLQFPEGVSLRLDLYACGFAGDLNRRIDFTAFTSEQLARIFNVNPTRPLKLHTGTWSREQSVVMASRPNVVNLILVGGNAGGFTLEDDGTAFVDALSQRQCSFGSLTIVDDGGMPFSRINFQRLFEHEVFEQLTIGSLDQERVLLPFSAKTKALVYTVQDRFFSPETFRTLNIVAHDLTLTIKMANTDNWCELLVSLLNRVAVLGHFKRLTFTFTYFAQLPLDWDNETRVVQALIGAIKRNPELEYLDLSDSSSEIYWAPHLPKLFKSMEGHQRLSVFKVNLYPPFASIAAADNHVLYPCLVQLLSHNRGITVLDDSGKYMFDGPIIRKLYSLNRLYNESPKLVKEQSTLLRPALVTTALLESTSESFSRTALLLSHHSDMLCELVDYTIVGPWKRKMRVQPERAAKKSCSK